MTNSISGSDTITLSDYNNVATGLAPTMLGSITGSIAPNNVWTTNGTSANWQSPYIINSGLTGTNSGTIELQGEKADIKVNGKSLMDAIQKIEERLNILTPNPTLEADWTELRELGDQYRKLEQHIKDKMGTWDRLIAMPPPQID
jgi:hypothetical protein